MYEGEFKRKERQLIRANEPSRVRVLLSRKKLCIFMLKKEKNVTTKLNDFVHLMSGFMSIFIRISIRKKKNIKFNLIVENCASKLFFF